MVELVLLIQIISLVFFFKIIMESELDSFGFFWYCIAGLHFLCILRFVYVEINFSYLWYEQIMQFISLGISLLIVIPTLIYCLIKRNRKQKQKK